MLSRKSGKYCFSLVLLCLGLPVIAQKPEILPEIMPKIEAKRSLKMHPLYRTREQVASLPKNRMEKVQIKMNDAGVEKEELEEELGEDPERTKARWNTAPAPDTYQILTQQAFSKRRDIIQPLDFIRNHPLISSTAWEQMGVGIHNNDGTHHIAGRIRCAAYAPDNSQSATVLYAGSSSGGLWKPIILGILAIWTPISDNLVGSPSVGAFLVHAQDSNKILIGSGDQDRYAGSGLYRTLNAGGSWELRPISSTPACFYRILADRSDPNGNTVLAAANNGIWKSIDFGGTWNRVYNGAVTDLAQDPVFYSFWYAGAPGIGVLESSNSGGGFHPINGSGHEGMNTDIGRVSVSVCETSANYVYAIISKGNGTLNAVYRSTNYGSTWTAITSSDTISGGQGFHTSAIHVDPNNPAKLYAGMAGLIRTTNATSATVTWAGVDGGHADYTNFVFQPGTSTIIMCNDGGYYAYSSDTNTVSGLGNKFGLNCEQIGAMAGSRTNPNLLISGLQDNGIVSTNDTRATVNIFHLGGDGGATSISADNDSTWAFSNGIYADGFHRFLTSNSAISNG